MFEGMSRTYSKELLEEYEAKNFEYNGKKLTEYEALQEQRKLERQIRRWKREQNALQAAGLDTSEATAKVREWNGKHKDFLEQTGLKADGARTVVGKVERKLAKNVEFPDDFMSRNKNISDGIKKEIVDTITEIEKEYNFEIHEIVYKDISNRGKVPFQYYPFSDKGIYKAKLIINTGYDWNPTLEEFNERIYNKNYKKGVLASKTTADLIWHECVHFITFQECVTWEDFVKLERLVRREFISGVSGYADATEDGAESIAEALVRKRNEEPLSDKAKNLLEQYIVRWKK